MNFKLKVMSEGSLFPVFEGEPKIRDTLRDFLLDIEQMHHAGWQPIFEAIAQARRNENVPTFLGGNATEADLYSAYAEIEHNYIYTKEGENVKVKISLDELEEMIRAWKEALDEWEASSYSNDYATYYNLTH